MEIKRDRYLKKLIDSRQNGFIKAVTGIRRCGKSYLLNVLFYHYLLDLKSATTLKKWYRTERKIGYAEKEAQRGENRHKEA